MYPTIFHYSITLFCSQRYLLVSKNVPFIVLNYLYLSRKESKSGSDSQITRRFLFAFCPYLYRHAPAVTLVPQIGTPRVRNLQFGNPKVSVQNSDQSPASQSANATAKVIGVPPEGIPTATPGGPDDWCCCTVT